MSILSSILGKTLVSPIEAIGNVLDKLFTSDDEILGKKIILTRLAQSPSMAQIELNKIEAQHRSIFVAGARPFILWVCGCGLLFSFIINPLIQWTTGNPGPNLPTDVMHDLVISILGLGGYRSIEKIAGRTK